MTISSRGVCVHIRVSSETIQKNKRLFQYLLYAFERERERIEDSFIHNTCMSGMIALVTYDSF